MKSGFVAILGRPNVGKSTLLNAILSRKVSIVTDKSQTTRNSIKGIYNSEDCQIVFTDTPGIHKPRQKLGEEMNNMAYSAAHDVDCSILVVDASKPYGVGDDYIIEHLDIHKTPLVIVFNKIDQARINKVEELKSIYRSHFENAVFVDTVATEKFNVDEVLKAVKSFLPEGPAYYSRDTYTDKDEVFGIKEIIREKVLKILRDEVPHSIAIYMENIEWEKDPIEIRASIIVEKDSQKGIVIGANGKRIKQIGTNARYDIERLLGKHVFLELFVKVQEDWRDDEKSLEAYGYKAKQEK
ncbi:MAG: GTPase Era [Bacilli bacterium]|nr:GTPase Era [Bacilli bacterium]